MVLEKLPPRLFPFPVLTERRWPSAQLMPLHSSVDLTFAIASSELWKEAEVEHRDIVATLCLKSWASARFYNSIPPQSPW